MSQESSFEDLIERVRLGDEDAAGQLVAQYEPEIRRFIRYRLGAQLAKAVDSGNVWQSILLRLFVNLRDGRYQFDDPGRLRQMLVTMARHKILQHARKPGNRPKVQEDSEIFRQVADGEESPSQIVSREELTQRVERELSPRERYLAAERRHGREWQDLADELGESPEALRKQLARAFERIAEHLRLEDLGV